MKICIVAARGGSKRLPKKNLLLFRGKPMVQIALETAIASGVFNKVVLSSEDPEILEVGYNLNSVEVLKRDSALSGDDVRADDVIRDVAKILNLRDSDLVCCLSPTTPLLTAEVFRDALNSYSANGATFGVTKSLQTPFRSFMMEPNGKLISLFPRKLNDQSHDYPDTFNDAGQFYIATKRVWDSNMSITATPGAIGFELSYELSIDINAQIDWEMLQRLHP
jgi:CMP-N-acetylneuraminic acid synthetase